MTDLRQRPEQRETGHYALDPLRCYANRPGWPIPNPYTSAFYNALSLYLLHNKAFFSDALIACKERLPTELGTALGTAIDNHAVRAAIHIREHRMVRATIRMSGRYVRHIEEPIEAALRDWAGKDPVAQLCMAMCLQHIAATISKSSLTHPGQFAGVSDAMSELWLWQASGEAEYDGLWHEAWMIVTADWHPMRRWWVSHKQLAAMSRIFFKRIRDGQWKLLCQDDVGKRRAFFGMLAHCLGRGGLVRHIMGAWFSFGGALRRPSRQTCVRTAQDAMAQAA